MTHNDAPAITRFDIAKNIRFLRFVQRPVLHSLEMLNWPGLRQQRRVVGLTALGFGTQNFGDPLGKIAYGPYNDISYGPCVMAQTALEPSLSETHFDELGTI